MPSATCGLTPLWSGRPRPLRASATRRRPASSWAGSRSWDLASWWSAWCRPTCACSAASPPARERAPCRRHAVHWQAWMANVGIIGLGYVGLPLAVAFAQEGCDVVAVDVDARKVEAIAAGDSYIEAVPSETRRELSGRTPA